MTLLLTFSITAQTMAATLSNQNVPKVSFTFDDGYTSALKEAAPALATYGYTGTSFVITGCVGMTTVPNACAADNDKTYMTWEEILALRDTYKWEVGSHTVTHPLLVSTENTTDVPLTKDQIITELTQSKADLAAHGITATSFADPYGDWNPTSLAEIAKLYTVHRPFADIVDYANNNHNNAFPYSEYLPYVVQIQAGVTLDQIKQHIDRAKANNYHLVFILHDIKSGTASTDPANYEYNTADLAQIAAYAKLQGMGNANLTDAFTTGTNLLSNGGFENGTTGWTTDALTSIKLDSANNGAAPSPQNSLSLTSGVTDAHLFFDLIPVNSVEKYIVKSYLNVTSIGTLGSKVGFYIDEYDATGKWLSTQAKPSEGSVWVEMLNFQYVPTSAAVTQARVQIVVTAGVGLNAYLDNVQVISMGGVVMLLAGDIDGNGLIDALDLSLLLTNWGKVGVPRAQGDLNADSNIDALDLSLVLTNWSK